MAGQGPAFLHASQAQTQVTHTGASQWEISMCTFAISVTPCSVDTGAAAQSALIVQVVDALGKGLSPGARRALTLWLGGCAGWVFSMVVLGGMTRLTRSGLSMTDWKFTGERAPGSQVQSLLPVQEAYMYLRLLFSCACPIAASLLMGFPAVWPLIDKFGMPIPGRVGG